MEPDIFKLLGSVRSVTIIASGSGVRIRQYLSRKYGPGKWRKMKGLAFVEDQYGWIGNAEIHWYEAHGIGCVDWKIKTRFF
jgi:hypothetical protein